MKTIFTRKAHAFLGAAAFMLAAVFTMACKMETNSAPETFSVQFDAKEHGALIAKVSGKQINADTKQEKGTIVEFTATPEDGYAVDTWTITGSAFEKNSGTDGSLTAKVKITKNTTVNVSFTKNSYAVSFDAKGGSPVPEAQTVFYKDKAAAPTEPVKEGYTFAGWFNKAGNEPWDFAANAVTANTELYAKWQVKKHTVTFSVNDGNGELTAKLDGNTFTTGTEAEYGKTIKFTATPEDGYAVDTWTITGSAFEKNSGTDGSLTAKVKITENTTVNVTFKQEIYKTVPFGVRGAGLDRHLKNTAPHTDGIYYIKVTGLTAADLKGNLSGGAVPSALGKILNKNPTKKVALKLEEVADVTDMSCCFYGCESLTQPPAIPNSVTNMSYCFYFCTSLTQAPVIPSSVTSMSGCFYFCESLTSVTLKCNYLPNTMYMQYSRDAFKYCRNLSANSIKVPADQLSAYQGGASTMGTTADRFVADN